jgi:hypothetical protein
MTDDVQYYPPASEFKLAKEAAAQKMYSQSQSPSQSPMPPAARP